MLILDLLLHRYIRTGDMLTTYNRGNPKPASTYSVVVQGFGRYAAVLPRGSQYGAIRRDGIKKDAAGKWVYRYGY